jgi:ParB family chromosome partitioning protein
MPKQMEDEFENVRGMFFRAIGTDVKISCSSKGGGKISIPFKDADALRRIISLFSKIG